MHRNKKCHFEHFNCCLIRKWGITIETRVSRYYITHTKKTANWTSNRIVIVKRKYIFEIETPPFHAICLLVRHYKPMEAASFV